MPDTHSALPPRLDGDSYRRACWDDQCRVRATCRLWTERDLPGFAVRCMTWRQHYRCFTEPCDHFLPAHREDTPDVPR